MSICSLIPPATAISKTQDRADTSVRWKLPFSIFFIIYYVQSAIINKVCKPELWFLSSAHPIIVLYICMKFHENISNNFEDIERTHVYVWWKWPFSIFKGHVISWCYHFVSSFTKICQAVLKLYSGHKNCLQTHTHKKENYIPHCMHTSYAWGITTVTVHVFCTSSHGVKFV